ncbi:MAG: vWA domain-containing protein, partial [Pseudoalteromonas sp.]
MNNITSNNNRSGLCLTVLSSAILVGLAGCNQTSRNEVTEQEEQLDSNEVTQTKVDNKQRLSQQYQLQKEPVLQVRNSNIHVASLEKVPQDLMHTNAVTTSAMPQPAIIDDGTFTTKQDRENYLKSQQNPVKQVKVAPVSTFSIDVDTGSYSNTRRMLNVGQLPSSDAVREEAFINYFDYDYSAPTNIATPFNVETEIASAPWNEHRQLLKIGIKGFEIEKADLKAANLVFLLDVSGSMNAPNKLPLLKTSLTMLTKQLDENDSVAIVVYAGAAGVVLPASKGNDEGAITAALNKLAAGGSTNGEQGIEL